MIENVLSDHLSLGKAKDGGYIVFRNNYQGLLGEILFAGSLYQCADFIVDHIDLKDEDDGLAVGAFMKDIIPQETPFTSLIK